MEKHMKNENEIIDSDGGYRVRKSSSPGKEFDKIDENERRKMKQMRPTIENCWVRGYL